MELTAQEVWSRVQELARGTVPGHAFSTWIASAKPLGLTDDELILEAQNRFHVEWLEDKFGPFLASAAERVVGRPIRIVVSCAASAPGHHVPSVEVGSADPAAADPGAPCPRRLWSDRRPRHLA